MAQCVEMLHALTLVTIRISPFVKTGILPPPLHIRRPGETMPTLSMGEMARRMARGG